MNIFYRQKHDSLLSVYALIGAAYKGWGVEWGWLLSGAQPPGGPMKNSNN